MIDSHHFRYRMAVLLMALALGISGWLSLTLAGRKLCCSGIYKTFSSPDQRFQVAVFRTSQPWPVAPGSAGDAPGFVRLMTRAGGVLQEQDVEAVQLVEQVRWTPRSVEIPLIAEWALPGGTPVPPGPDRR
ncbi:hypothetical protein C8234_04660 [Paracidovorax avenae]|uniref:hypothetical protein n=1 Tax=Paracidovorax avenae TaxID=80867 RepID=UPI000D2286DF|nr:hypothetical protein [Paracidovorax avenae]AVS77438.1 hypothetical protein C8234_04660 [Paracidovorax avenae]